MSEENLLDDLLSAAIEEIPELDTNNSNDKEKPKSSLLLHSGDTDSSDDEDNRDFENKKYNESGREIKHLLSVSKPEANQEASTTTYNIKSSWKTKLAATPTVSKFSTAPKPSTAPQPSTVSKTQTNSDSVFGMRVVNPVVSSKVLEDRMVGREFIPLARIKMFVRNVPQDKDWVVAGVLVHKSGTKTSQKGKNFCVWTISDLKNDLKTIGVFLFGNAYKELWKTVVGTVIGILNPSVMDTKEGSRDEACLSVMTHQRLMIIGQSKDLGTCKSITKSGDRCTAFVNVNVCEFCLYHVKQEYQKCSNKRSDLQSNFTGGGLTALRNKVLGKDQVFYAGKLYTSIPAKRNKKQEAKDEGRLQALAAYPTGKSKILGKNPVTKKARLHAAQLELARGQRQKDLERLRQLGIDKDFVLDGSQPVKFDREVSSDITVENSKSLALSVINKLKMNKDNNDTKENSTLKSNESEEIDLNLDFKKQIKQNINSSLKVSKPDTFNKKLENVDLNVNVENTKSLTNIIQSSPFLNHTPMLSGSTKTKIDLSLPIKQKRAARAKQSAVAWVQSNGPIKKKDPNNTRGSNKGKKRALEALNELDVTKLQEVKKSKFDENEFFSERFKKMMSVTSKHMDLLEQRDNEEQEKYFCKLEMKERMEEKMLTTYKIACKAVRCLKCKYTNFSASDLCKTEKHPLKVFDAVKRFFKCGNCSNRTVTLSLIPTSACKNCNSSKWQKTSMMKEKKVEIMAPKLSIRGGEQTFVNSVAADANLDLLVPDD